MTDVPAAAWPRGLFDSGGSIQTIMSMITDIPDVDGIVRFQEECNYLMTMTLWRNAKIATPKGLWNDGYLLVDTNGTIAEAGREGRPGSLRHTGLNGAERDLGGRVVLPGLIDVHVHGGGGFKAMSGEYADLDGMSRFHAESGTTSFLATTMTDAPEAIERTLAGIARAKSAGVSGAELLGAHLEGPFLNALRAGAQSKTLLADPDERMIAQFLQVADGCIRLVTLAPELPGGLTAAARFKAAGATVSAGHTDATFAQMKEAIRHGVTHTTHHFNGMRPMHHREPGATGAGLVLPELTIELIADGIHVHPEMLRMVFLTKPISRICIVTDAVGCAGLPDGAYGDVVMERGQVMSRDRSTLAGSSLTMIEAMRNTLRFTGLSLMRVLPAFTSTPARQIGAEGRKGTLEVGKDADFIVVNDDCELLMTVVRGKTIVDRALDS